MLTNFLEMMTGAFTYAKEGFGFIAEIYDLFPRGIQNVFFAAFVLIFGFATIRIVLNALKS